MRGKNLERVMSSYKIILLKICGWNEFDKKRNSDKKNQKQMRAKSFVHLKAYVCAWILIRVLVYLEYFVESK